MLDVVDRTTKREKETILYSIIESKKEMYRQINDGSYKSPNLKLINPTKEVMEVLKMSGFDMLISIEDDLKTAVASF